MSPSLVNPALVSLRGVSKHFGAVAALRSVDLDVARGQTLALIGPSGCGKSTLLRLMVGLERPDATGGEMLFEGEPVDAGRFEALRRRVGYVIQDGGLFPHLSGRQNVELAARHFGVDADARRRRTAELAELVRLPQALLDRRPDAISGGQRQRVSLMRALALDPDLLLLDEPLGALDPMIRYELQEDLASIFAALGKTVVIVTHDLAEAAFFAHEVVLLQGGRIVQKGRPSELVQAPADAFVERFVRAQRSLRFDDAAPGGEGRS